MKFTACYTKLYDGSYIGQLLELKDAAHEIMLEDKILNAEEEYQLVAISNIDSFIQGG